MFSEGQGTGLRDRVEGQGSRLVEQHPIIHGGGPPSMSRCLLLLNRRFQDPGGESRLTEVSTGHMTPHKPPALSLWFRLTPLACLR